MHAYGILNQVQVVKTHDEVTAGTSASNGTIIDCANAEGVVFITVFGTSAADNGVKVQQGAASNMSDAADLADTQTLLDATETTCVVEVVKPRERYLRSVAVRGTSSTVPAGIAIVFGKRSEKYDNDTQTDVAAESHVSPAEGTA